MVRYSRWAERYSENLAIMDRFENQDRFSATIGLVLLDSLASIVTNGSHPQEVARFGNHV